MDVRPNRRNKAAFLNFSRVAKFMHFFSSDLLTVEEKKSLSVSQDILTLRRNITVKIVTREP